MKSSKYFLALPMAITALVACGSNQTNFKETSYENLLEMTENYKTSISNSKASSIVVSGHVNKISVIGDATWWSSAELADAGGPLGMLGMIPNFSLKNSEIHIDSEDIASFSMPGQITSLAKDLMISGGLSSTSAVAVLGNLPKFPMNSHLLTLLYGFKSIPEDDDGNILWDDIEYLSWGDKATVKFYNGDGRLKVEIDTEDIEGFFDEIGNRMKGEEPKNEDPEPETKKYPGHFSLTTSKIGYIDSLSAKFKVDDIDGEIEGSDMLYGHIKGSAEVDLSLNFKQKISNPITIKYQLLYYKKVEDRGIEYNYVSDPGDDTPPVTYYFELDEEKSKEPTYDLDTLKDYVTFEWFSNLTTKTDSDSTVNGKSKKGRSKIYTVKPTYDDVIFEYNYWNTNKKNVAFTDESYNVLAIPAHTVNEEGVVTPKYSILGAYPRKTYGGEEAITKSLCSTSIDGRVVSSNTGIPYDGGKALESASDALQMLRLSNKKYAADTYDLLADEIYINSNLLGEGTSEYVINIAITDYLGE